MTGIPVFNVNNNCSTGSTALYLARQAIESGAADCVLALGFEQGAAGGAIRQAGERVERLARDADYLAHERDALLDGLADRVRSGFGRISCSCLLAPVDAPWRVARV
jgi:acetyl-CoA acetyltransferase